MSWVVKTGSRVLSVYRKILVLILFASVFGLAPYSRPSEQGQAFKYLFSWSLLPVASLEIDFSDYDSDNLISSSGATSGLSRLLKNYRAEVSIRETEARTSVYYELLGVDRGVEEVRKIRFAEGKIPNVIEFIDSTDSEGLVPRTLLDENAVDPLTVFSWFYRHQPLSSVCFNSFKVFDGKRRFVVEIRKIDEARVSSVENLSAINCRITMMNRPSESSKFRGRKETGNFWPFNKKDQTIDVLVVSESAKGNWIQEIVIYSPFGKIIGRLDK